MSCNVQSSRAQLLTEVLRSADALAVYSTRARTARKKIAALNILARAGFNIRKPGTRADQASMQLDVITEVFKR
jgi:hypothetical protein